MFEDIKSRVEDSVKGLELSPRDQAGVDKIMFELDLLQSNHKPKSKKKASKSQ